jgi:phosphate transport system permease protein
VLPGVAVGLIIVPLIASVADDAMRSVPRALREGAYALGASKLRVALKVVVPAAFSGIVAAFVLGGSRAVGETMIVLLVAGAGSPNVELQPLRGCSNDDRVHCVSSNRRNCCWLACLRHHLRCGRLLFIITLTMNIIAIRFVERFREAYE